MKQVRGGGRMLKTAVESSASRNMVDPDRFTLMISAKKKDASYPVVDLLKDLLGVALQNHPGNGRKTSSRTKVINEAAFWQFLD